MAGVLIKNFTPGAGGRPRFWVFFTSGSRPPAGDISLVFVSPAKARALNKQLRGKDYVPSVLSYIAGNKSAEIIICPAAATQQAPDFQLPARSFLLLLFIHGLLH